MNETTCLQLENLIRTNAPTPPSGSEGLLDQFVTLAKKNDKLISLALITLMSQGLTARKSFKMLTNVGISKEEIFETLRFMGKQLGISLAQFNRNERFLLIKLRFESTPEHGPN